MIPLIAGLIVNIYLIRRKRFSSYYQKIFDLYYGYIMGVRVLTHNIILVVGLITLE